jgi:hypothetical protein
MPSPEIGINTDRLIMLNKMMKEIEAFMQSTAKEEIEIQINNEYMDLISDVLSPDPTLRDMKDYNAGRASGLSRALALISALPYSIQEDINILGIDKGE